MSKKLSYCESRFVSKRNKTRVVNVGGVYVGGDNPIRIQSMTNTPTQDVDATVKQSIALAEAGCEIVRVTAQNVDAAKALKDIRKKFTQAGFAHIPLVADIHFLPKAAMEAIEHVEKVRVNPGNYADKKKFAIIEYSDAQYQEELERLHEAFTPLVLRAKELGRTLRIGTNHGSLSDRIMNRFGDTPLGMVESALEFVRIAQHHNFYDIILSLKASNPKVMIQAYRLSVQKMKEENMAYPLHLGVTEAGDGEDGRIKSAIGIGSLLADGLGDTIRVSLTEDPVYEIPVAKNLAELAHKLWAENNEVNDSLTDSINPYEYRRRESITLNFKENIVSSSTSHPPVFIKIHKPLSEYQSIAKEVIQLNNTYSDAKIEGLIFEIKNLADLVHLESLQKIFTATGLVFILDLADETTLEELKKIEGVIEFKNKGWILCKKFKLKDEIQELSEYLKFTQDKGLFLAIDALPPDFVKFREILEEMKPTNLIVTTTQSGASYTPIGTYRVMAETLKSFNIPAPSFWIRNTFSNTIDARETFDSKILEASIYTGSLLCDGLGDIVSIEEVKHFQRATALGYNILQGARLRFSKTEFVACPSCGRTLFDLETTTAAIREKTGHLKGVTIAVMGCIVNGPGEMADADFGYVGGAPQKINLYVGKECVQYGIPQEEAVEKLIELIKKHNKWVEPKTVALV
ncbi:MAG: 4-hydroxy-3-methylbut-2-en-1-yl diphosphate synthase [Verrucomicrobia bacterium]|nr:MAG: 4-hydroxy-3-methylbut-2-en-1-yl diphosphate synthase [Verrucomicrobiota bacterium]